MDLIGFLKENCNVGSKTLDFLRKSNHFDRNQWFSLENPKENCIVGSKTLDSFRKSNHFHQNHWFSLENPKENCIVGSKTIDFLGKSNHVHQNHEFSLKNLIKSNKTKLNQIFHWKNNSPMFLRVSGGWPHLGSSAC